MFLETALDFSQDKSFFPTEISWVVSCLHIKIDLNCLTSSNINTRLKEACNLILKLEKDDYIILIN